MAKTRLEANVSEATKTALDAAIQAHIAEEFEGEAATSWVLVTEVTPASMVLDGSGGIFIVEDRDMQSEYLTRGLLWSALNANKGTQ